MTDTAKVFDINTTIKSVTPLNVALPRSNVQTSVSQYARLCQNSFYGG